jgi:hypothetical protein
MMNFPQGKKFAFTIVDDTDYSTLENIKPVYDLLFELGIKTTKTVWAFEQQPLHFEFYGDTLSDEKYRAFIVDLQKKGFEIAWHGAKSGFNNKAEIENGLKLFQSILGHFPEIHINHAHNPDNIYWGADRFTFPLRNIFKFFEKYSSNGHVPDSPHFWGDLHKKHITYTRNFNFSGLNTLKNDPWMPYLDREKIDYSNYWFSCADGGEIERVQQLLTEKNILQLEKENGLCILYVHFADKYCINGKLDPEFEASMRYLATRSGWFVPAGTLLNFLRENRYKKNQFLSRRKIIILNFKYILSKVVYSLKKIV